jgi:hypothetical protein
VSVDESTLARSLQNVRTRLLLPYAAAALLQVLLPLLLKVL